jgi:ABC-type glycerol-3-phosphate transport system substrate-binding protein
MTWENNDTNASLDAAMALFMKANPNLTVQRVPSPSTDYGQKVNSMLQAKQLPDIIWSGNDTEQQFGSQGLLYDWTSKANATKTASFDLSKFAPASIDNWKVGDKLFGLPTLMNTYGVWYNADAMTKAGLTIPKAGWTYDEMLKDAAALTTKSGSTTNWGLVNAPYDPFAIGDCSVSSGGAPFADKINNPTKVTIDDKFKACAQKYIDAIKAGSLNPPEAAPSGDDATNGFIAGKIPMLYFGQWLAPSFSKAKISFKYGFAPLPVAGTAVQPYDAVGIISPTTIKSPDAVWAVSQFLASGVWEQVLPSAPVAPAAYVPASQPYFDALNKMGLNSVADSVNYILNTANKQPIRFTATWSAKAGDILKQWNDILDGKTPLDSGSATMVQQLNDLIKSGG